MESGKTHQSPESWLGRQRGTRPRPTGKQGKAAEPRGRPPRAPGQGWGGGWGALPAEQPEPPPPDPSAPHHASPAWEGVPRVLVRPQSRSLPPTRIASAGNVRGALPALPGPTPLTPALYPRPLAPRGARGVEDAPARGTGLRGEPGGRDSPPPRSPQPKPSAREPTPPTGRGGPHLAAARPPTLLLQTGDELQLLLLVRAVHFGRWGRE